ncbi:MAG: serine/threonine protein kinase [Gammaproteobacteria bacterium]
MTSNVVDDEDQPNDRSLTPYNDLTPERILAAVESLGMRCDGRLLALNSYENRVYQVGIEDAAPVIVKFYRPGRWSDACILEEHRFTFQLAENEIPAVPPLRDHHGESLHKFETFRFSVYPRRGGRAPELGDDETLTWLGRFIGRIHGVGRSEVFKLRPRLSVELLGEQPLRYLIEHEFIPKDLIPAFQSVAESVLSGVRQCFEATGDVELLRLHGDCHPGNVLWTESGPLFVDFDDCMTGPAIQDLWMLLSGSREEMAAQMGHVLDGYEEFTDFNYSELRLIEALRSLRMIHYAGWLAKRWRDPAFPMHFPWFNTQRYWQDQVLALREQLAALQEPPLSLRH